MKRRSAVALTFLLSAVCLPAVAEDWQVWTETTTRRVLRDEPAGEQSTAALSAARNEWESFQILIRSGATIQGVNIAPGDLRGPDGAILRANDARLYRQHQLQLTAASYRNDPFQPGWYPDALIPFRHPLTGDPLPKARFQAVPFDLPENETHGFLVDVKVPRDARPGTYQGVYRVSAEGRKPLEIPVTVDVWDFALPDTPTFNTAFGSPAQRVLDHAAASKEQPAPDRNAVFEQTSQLLSEHGFNATPSERFDPLAQADGSFRTPRERIDTLRQFIDRYHVNAIQVPRPTTIVKDPVAERAKLRGWLAAWDRAIEELDRPGVLFFTYLHDEPNDKEAYESVRLWGGAMRAAKTRIKILVVEQPQTQDAAWGDLYGAVDIWCPLFSLFEPDPAAARQRLGETIWTYTALCQGKEMSPWWQTDFPLLHYRVPAWISWRDHIQGLLYWGGMAYWKDAGDPWTNPITLDRRDRRKDGRGPIYNGEGSLVYPGRDVGYDGIAPSLRLKALRDSIEDYEYMAILERLGRAEDARRVVEPLAGSWFQWDPNPASYQKARAALAELILKARP